MNEGKLFEQDFKKSVPPDVYYYRIKDSASSWGGGDQVRFTPKNEFDLIMYKHPHLYTLELKSTSGTSISFDGTSSMIHQHQIKELTKSSIIYGIISGFIFNFRTSGNTYFMNINDFNNFVSSTTKKSINEKDISSHNGVLIESILLRKRKRYSLDKFVDSSN